MRQLDVEGQGMWSTRANFGNRCLLLTLLLTALIGAVSMQESCSRSPVYSKSHYISKPINTTKLLCLNHHYNGKKDNEHIAVPKHSFSVSILFTGDIHGRLREIPRIAALKTRLQETGNAVMLLDAGDVSFGSTFDQYYGYTGSYDIMQLAGYDAISLGNHDDLSGLKDGQGSQELMAPVPVVCVNPGRVLGTRPSVVLNVSGVTVGVVGYTTSEHFEEHKVIENIIREVICLKQRHRVDLMVLLAHGGLRIDLSIQHSHALQGYIDLILGGHSHSMVNCNHQWHVGSRPFLVHSGYNGKYFVDITVLGKNMDLTKRDMNTNATMKHPRWDIAMSSTPYKLTSLPAPPPTSLVAKQLLQKHQQIQVLLNTSINNKRTTQPLFVFNHDQIDDTRNCRIEQCITGKIITSAVLQHFDCHGIVVFESGSIRENFPLAVSERGLNRSLPWLNRMIKVRMSGEEFRRALEHSRDSKGSGKFLQIGIPHKPSRNSCSFSLNSLATLEKIDYVALFSQTEEVDVIMTDWLASGGDEYNFSNVDVLQQSTLMSRDIVREFLHHLTILSSNISKISNISTNSSSETSLFNYYEGTVASVCEGIAIFLTYPLMLSISKYQAFGSSKDKPIVQKIEINKVVNYVSFALLFSVRVISSAVFWSMYYAVLRSFNSSYGVVSVSLVRAKRGFMASTVSAGINTIMFNPMWVVISHMQVFNEFPDASILHNICGGISVNLVLILYPSIKMFLYELIVTISQPLLMGSGVLQSAIANGLTGSVASLLSTIVTYPLQTIRMRLQTQTKKEGGDYYDGLSMKLLSVVAFDFIYFFSYKVFAILIEEIPV